MSKFEHNSQPKPPAFGTGYVKGSLEVLAIAGRSNRNPGDFSYKTRKESTWWYVVRCDCGNTETVDQKSLTDSSPRVSCLACSKRDKYIRIAESLRNKGTMPLAPKPVLDIPDFARMKLR